MLHLRPLGQLSVYVIPFSFEKLFARTDGKNNKIFNFRTEQKLSIYGEFEGSILPNSQKISSHVRYDHFDTSPCGIKIVYQKWAFVNDFILKCFVRYDKIYLITTNYGKL